MNKPKTINWHPPTNLPCCWKTIQIKEEQGMYESPTGAVVLVTGIAESDGTGRITLSIFRNDHYATECEAAWIADFFFREGIAESFVIDPKPEWGDHYRFCVYFQQRIQEGLTIQKAPRPKPKKRRVKG